MMSTGFGFCAVCRTPRTPASQKVCAACGSAFGDSAPRALPADRNRRRAFRAVVIAQAIFLIALADHPYRRRQSSVRRLLTRS